MLKARKRFGQNFLIDNNIIDRIGRGIGARPDQHLVEIGPGRGALTDQLVASGCDLTLVEIDRDLSAQLAKRYPEAKLINQDVLKFDFDSLSDGQTKLRVVGNLPYNISTPLMFKLFENATLIDDMHFMLQLEVVDRITASPNTKAYGRLTIMSQIYCDVEKLFEVPPYAFSPRPKVQSAIVRLTPKRRPGELDMTLLETILIDAFNARRKTIRNGLRKHLSAEELESLDLSPTLRPENLDINDFIRCTQLVAQKSANKT
ncbi:MAG: 16S rRNA (adenine1518-N6/adenine1519-N6)-dimethyltransferase [Candidatus Azotimanducaceae bacterium]